MTVFVLFEAAPGKLHKPLGVYKTLELVKTAMPPESDDETLGPKTLYYFAELNYFE